MAVFVAGTGYDKKHRHCIKPVPSIKDAMGMVSKTITRVKWMWFHRHQQSTLPSIVIKSRKVLPCCHLVPPTLEAWATTLRVRIARVVKRARSAAQSRRHDVDSPITRWALRRLRQSEWTMVQTDKDGGFAFELKSIQREVHDEILQKAMYKDVHLNAMKNDL